MDWPRGERFPFSPEAEPFTAADMTPDVKGRLLARAEARLVRIQAAERLAEQERFWLVAELRLVLLGRVHPKMLRRWRDNLAWRTRHAERRLTEWQKLEGLLLAHEPAADAWLRRQLAGLSTGEVTS